MDYESEFFRIVAGVNTDGFPPFTGHATPREWLMHERVSDDVPVTDRSRPFNFEAYCLEGATSDPFGTPIPPLPTDHAKGWVDPRNGHLYLPGEHVPDYHNHQRATWEHPGNPNPYLNGPRNALGENDD